MIQPIRSLPGRVGSFSSLLRKTTARLLELARRGQVSPLDERNKNHFIHIIRQ